MQPTCTCECIWLKTLIIESRQTSKHSCEAKQKGSYSAVASSRETTQTNPLFTTTTTIRLAVEGIGHPTGVEPQLPCHLTTWLIRLLAGFQPKVKNWSCGGLQLRCSTTFFFAEARELRLLDMTVPAVPQVCLQSRRLQILRTPNKVQVLELARTYHIHPGKKLVMPCGPRTEKRRDRHQLHYRHREGA